MNNYRNERILIVDDDAVSIVLMKEFIASEGYEHIRAAGSAEEGLRLMREDVPDIVLLDVIMPGMDGIEMCRQIKGDALLKHVPVLIVTAAGVDSEESIEKSFDAGASDYITKPIQKVELLVRIQSVLRLKQTRELIRQELESRTRAEKALSVSEEKFRTVFNAVQAGIFIVDPDTKIIIDANPEAVRLFGASREQIIGKVCHNFICPAEMGKCPVTDLGETVDNSERALVTVTGARLPVYKSVAMTGLQDKKYLVESFIDISAMKKSQEERERLISELKSAIENIKTLKGLLPICASCRKVRDDKGYWNQLEIYIEAHTDTSFTHGICPECIKKLYPELAADLKEG